jgi:hypothetical protein
MANKYWVGGTGTWSAANTANWSAASGGAGGAAVPTTADVAIFDSASNAGSSGASYTVTRTATTNVLGIQMANPSAGTLTFAGSSVIGITTSGLTVSTGVSWTNTGVMTFSGTCSVSTNNVSIASPVTISGSAITVTLGSAFTTTGAFTLTQGTFALTTFNLTCLTFTAPGTLTRSLTQAGADIYVTGNNATVYDVSSTTGFTFSARSFYFTYAGSTGTRTLACSAGLTGNDLRINAGSDIVSITGAGAAINQLFFSGFSGTWSGTNAISVFGNLLLSSTMTVSYSGAITFSGTAGPILTTSTKTLNSTLTIALTSGPVYIAGSATTTGAITYTSGNIDLTNGGAGNYTLTGASFTSSNTNTRVITFGTGGITTTGSGTAFNVTGTNLSYTGTPTVNISNNSGVATTVTATGFTATNALNFNFTVGTYTLTETASNIYNNLNYTGFGGVVGNPVRTIYGNVTYSASATNISGANATTFAATSGTQTITSNGALTSFPHIQNGVGGTVQLADALIKLINSSSSTYTLTNGTFNANNFNLTVYTFSSNNSNVRTITMGSGTWSLGAGSVLSATAWDLTTTTNLTFNKNTANISLTANPGVSGNKITFAGGGLTYNNIDISLAGTTTGAIVAFTGSNTFGTMSSTRTVAWVLTLPSSATTTVSAFSIAGTAGNIVTINSSTSGTAATLTKSGGGTVSSDYLSIKDSAATPSTLTWYAGANSTNVSGNTGWIFTAPPTPSVNNGTFFLLFG